MREEISLRQATGSPGPNIQERIYTQRMTPLPKLEQVSCPRLDMCLFFAVVTFCWPGANEREREHERASQLPDLQRSFLPGTLVLTYSYVVHLLINLSTNLFIHNKCALDTTRCQEPRMKLQRSNSFKFLAVTYQAAWLDLTWKRQEDPGWLGTVTERMSCRCDTKLADCGSGREGVQNAWGRRVRNYCDYLGSGW